MGPDYSKRDYLLPPGCKDLMDVLKLEQRRKQKIARPDPIRQPKPQPQQPLPPITGEILVPAKTTVGDLAHLLNQKPFKIIADLMGLGVFASINHLLDFETVCKVLRQYGCTGKRQP